MIYISVVELIPSLFLEEDEEEQQPYGDHHQVQRSNQNPEPEGTLEVYAERNQHSVGNECPMHPAEAIGKTDDDPGDEAKERAVEYPLGELCTIAEREQGAVNQHNERTHWRDNAYYQPAGFP